MPKIAIITRTKDRPLLLKRALLSVLNQTFQDWIHVIVDDSEDKEQTLKILSEFEEQYQNRLQIIPIKKSKGADAILNIGIEASQSELITILDDDDSWEDNFLEEAIQHLESTKSQGIITHCNYVIEKIENSKVEELQRYPFNTDIKEITLSKAILSRVYPPPVSFIFKRKNYEKLGGFNEKLIKAGDIEFILRFLQKYKIFVLQKTLANYHTRPYESGAQANITQKDNSFWEKKLAKSLLKTNPTLGVKYHLLNSIKPLRNFILLKKKINFLKGKSIVLYGAGIRAEELLPHFKNLNIVGVLDNSKEKQGQKIDKYKIFAPEKIIELNPDIILLSVANISMVKPFIESLVNEYKLKCEVISFD